jgi:hypothetical protein
LYFLSTASSTELDIHDAAEAAQMVSEYVLSRRSDVISGYIYFSFNDRLFRRFFVNIRSAERSGSRRFSVQFAVTCLTPVNRELIGTFV